MRRFALTALIWLGVPDPAGSVELPPGFVVDKPNLQMFIESAYNSVDDEYVVTFTGGGTAWALRLDPCGAVLDEVAVLTNVSEGWAGQTAIAHNPDRNEYLFVMRDEAIDAYYLDRSLQRITGALRVSDTGSDTSIEYAGGAGRYMVRWQFANDQTWFRMLDADSGADSHLVTDRTLVAGGEGGAMSGQVAYSAVHDRFLYLFHIQVAWANMRELYGRFISGDGSTLEPAFVVDRWEDDAAGAFVTYVPTADTWVASWTILGGNTAYDVRAGLIAPDGTVSGKVTVGNTVEWDNSAPIAYNAITDTVVLTWLYAGHTVHARELDPWDGALLGETLTVAHGRAQTSVANRSVAGNPQVLFTTREGLGASGVHASMLDLEGDCTVEPGPPVDPPPVDPPPVDPPPVDPPPVDPPPVAPPPVAPPPVDPGPGPALAERPPMTRPAIRLSDGGCAAAAGVPGIPFLGLLAARRRQRRLT